MRKHLRGQRRVFVPVDVEGVEVAEAGEGVGRDSLEAARLQAKAGRQQGNPGIFWMFIELIIGGVTCVYIIIRFEYTKLSHRENVYDKNCQIMQWEEF